LECIAATIAVLSKKQAAGAELELFRHELLKETWELADFVIITSAQIRKKTEFGGNNAFTKRRFPYQMPSQTIEDRKFVCHTVHRRSDGGGFKGVDIYCQRLSCRNSIKRF
jgi:hypothetical protein